MVTKRLKDYENGKISSWEFTDIDNQNIVYYVKRIILDDGRIVIRFGKTSGKDFVKIYHFPRLAFNAFMEIADTLTLRLIQRGELDLTEILTEFDKKQDVMM